jgi:hypothetical protein
MPELSDADRRRLERGREAFAHVRQDIVVEAEHRRRFGPITLKGPDGVEVRLEVKTTGGAHFQAETAAIRLANATHEYGVSTPDSWWRAVHRPGFVLTIWSRGLPRRYRRHPAPDEQTAARLFAEASSAVTTGGFGALRWWATHQS